MTIGSFIADYLLPSETILKEKVRSGTIKSVKDLVRASMLAPVKTVAYLAQHSLFSQIIDLRKDFPECPFNPPNISSDGPRINCWLGTSGTVTPLHYDSYDNVFVQIVGLKKLILFSCFDGPCLYAGSRTDGIFAQGNISPVDPEVPDLQKYPRFAEAMRREVILGPGDVILIPSGVWHHVRSPSVSCSLSFMFTRS